MYATSAEQRSGLLVAIITGGRPALKQRPTRKYIEEMRTAGPADVVWVVSDQDAPKYERDDADLCVYPREWAFDYAASHWMNPLPPARDAFLGAFPGREWACMEAERRGCWGVLQLDDNIDRLTIFRPTAAGCRTVNAAGGMGLHLDLLSAMALATNAMTVGAALESVNAAARDAQRIIRPGFPYSLFVEKVGPLRENWYGPFEDDITHAFQYGDRADGVTAALMTPLRYHKENKSTTGMRKQYNQTRSQQLQRLIPQGAKVGVRSTRSNGQGTPRVFHTMLAGAIRNPVVVRDAPLAGRVKARIDQLAKEWYAAELEGNRAKIMRRLAASSER